ncbi:MAG TPA: hypothetical protein VMF66_11090 [Candidatus Acidoferrum sp.]|nr:hypothetical protein [Candidatus Acidoferrum sp.]
MPSTPNLFRLLNEFIVLLLGAILILLSATRRLALPSHPGLMVVLGFIFVFWAARAWARPSPGEALPLTVARAGSLGVVGVLLVAIPLLGLRRATMLIEVAGIVLVVRALICAGLSFRSPKSGTGYPAGPNA